jgi:hypothetical protein
LTTNENSLQVNSLEHARFTFDNVVNDMLHDMLEGHFKFYKQVNDDPKFASFFMDWLFKRYIQSTKTS